MIERKIWLLWLLLVALAVSLVTIASVGATASDALASNAVQDVITIAEARGRPLGSTVTVEGIVTVAAGSYNAGFAIQDATAGIYVYPSSFVARSLGDTVILTGTLANYSCLLEITPSPSNIQFTGPGTVPDPRPYPTGAINEASEGWLAVITGTVSGLPGNPFTLNDGSGAAEVYVDSSTGISLAGIQNGDRLRVVGFNGQYDSSPCDSGWQVMPRMQSDVALLDTVPPVVLNTVPPDGATGVNPDKPIFATFDEAIRPSSVNTATFLLEGPGGEVDGAVGYDSSSHTASLIPSATLLPLSPYTATLTTGIEDVTGNPLAANYVWTFSTGPLDTTPPSIVARYPQPGAVDVLLNTYIVITFSEELDPATVVPANFGLVGPYGTVSWDAVTYDPLAYRATLNPRGLLLPTSGYTVSISAGVTDWAGLAVPEGQRTWSFVTQAEPEMLAFHGDLHNHTSYSDGSGTPQQAFAHGLACGLEFMAISDHSYAVSDSEWQDILDQAEAATQNGVFVGLRGFEYTQGAEGHASVYNTVRHATRTEIPGCTYCDYTPNLEQGVTVEGFYHWLAVTGTQALDSAGTVMQFNHPGWINFNDWTYHPEVEDVVELEEVGNGWGSSYTFSWEEWLRSLDYGWHVAATNNADDHTTGWGCTTPHRTGVVMAALTKEDLMDALSARRTFATEDSNYELFFKANGYWMGAEFPNTGQITFELWGGDPDGEPTTLVQVYTAEGQVVAEIAPNTADFQWSFTQDITPGVHYYFVLATQADGDRIVSSPVWTEDSEDVRLTDLTIQPSIPTIYNPSLLTARVSNRGAAAQALTVVFQVDGVPVGSVPVTAQPCTSGPCVDSYASLSWQPVAVGPVDITAELQGAPAGDNPEDNSRTLSLDVTDERIPLVLIDAGHNNVSVDANGLRQFVDDLTLHGYNILFNLDDITASDLNTETVKLLILNAYGPDPLSAAETQAIADFVAAGGNLWLNGMSDYAGSVWWANSLAGRMNGLVAAVETSAGAPIPIRFNDDEVLDGNNNNGYPWGVLWHSFPVSDTAGVGMNVLKIQSWSVCSLVDRSGTALEPADLGENGFIMVLGDMDPGTGTYGEPNRTHNSDADNEGDAYLYPEGVFLPSGAGYDLPGQAGRLFFYGDSNDPFNTFAYVAGDGKQNELFNLEAVMWLLGDPLQKMTVAQARYDPELDDTPENLDRLVWVEGAVTAGYGEFFDVLYVQDDTGGITVFAPAGTASGAVEPDFGRGDCVRVVGTVDVYQGDTEIQFFETEQVQVLTPTCVLSPTMTVSGSLPLPLSTYSATRETYEGWLAVVTGTVVSKNGEDTLWVDDGSGLARLFLDGYNGTWSDVQVGDRVRVAGMVSEDGLGERLRVRNHGAHPELPDDVLMLPPLPPSYKIYLPLVAKND
jgi:hypothetical protein